MGSEGKAECYCTSHRECRVCLPDEQRAGGVTGDDVATPRRAVLVRELEDLRAGNAVLRTQLAAAERERDEANATLARVREAWTVSCETSKEHEAERDAATSRAETAERERDIISASLDDCEKLLAKTDARAEAAEGLLRRVVNAEWKIRNGPKPPMHDDVWALFHAMDAARSHLQSLKGGSDAEG